MFTRGRRGRIFGNVSSWEGKDIISKEVKVIESKNVLKRNHAK